MKKLAIAVCISILCILLYSSMSYAYFDRGDIEISAGKEDVNMEQGDTKTVSVKVTPSKDEQLPGCGMAECPQICGEKECLNADGECTCNGTKYQTYYANVTTASSNTSVAIAEYSNGSVTIKGVSAGKAKITLTAALRQYNSTSTTIEVDVVEKETTKAQPSETTKASNNNNSNNDSKKETTKATDKDTGNAQKETTKASNNNNNSVKETTKASNNNNNSVKETTKASNNGEGNTQKETTKASNNNTGNNGSKETTKASNNTGNSNKETTKSTNSDNQQAAGESSIGASVVGESTAEISASDTTQTQESTNTEESAASEGQSQETKTTGKNTNNATNEGFNTQSTEANTILSDKGKIIFVPISDGQIGKDVLTSIKGQGEYVDFQKLDASGTVEYAWEFYGMDIVNPFDLDLNIYPGATAFTGWTNNNQAKEVYVNFGHDGELPGKASIYLKVNEWFTDTDTVNLYQYDEENNEIIDILQNLTVTNGYVEFSLEHCSEYVLTTATVANAVEESSNGMPIWGIVVIVIALAAGVGAGYFVYKKNKKNKENKEK